MQALYRAVTRYDVQQWANHLFREAQAIPSVIPGTVHDSSVLAAAA